MKQLVRATALALAALLVVAAVAVAVPPTGGATYAGKSKGGTSGERMPVTLKVAQNRKSLTFTFSCFGDKYSVKNVQVNAQGGFSKKGAVAGVSVKVSGKFSSATKASGSFNTNVCFAGKPTFSVTRK
jgi:hypothetical protein